MKKAERSQTEKAGKVEASTISPLPGGNGRRYTIEPEFADHVSVEIQLEPGLLRWAKAHAFNMNWYLSDFIENILELERHREERPWTTHVDDDALRNWAARRPKR